MGSEMISEATKLMLKWAVREGNKLELLDYDTDTHGAVTNETIALALVTIAMLLRDNIEDDVLGGGGLCGFKIGGSI